MADQQKLNGSAAAPSESGSVSKVLEAVLNDSILPKNLQYEISSWVLCYWMQCPSASDAKLKERIEETFDSIEPCDFIPFQRLDDRPINVTNMEDEVKSVGV